MNISERFFAKVEPALDGSGCLLWTGARSSEGYGIFTINGRNVPAHRWLMDRGYGPIPKRMRIDHLCRNRGCVRPLHLEIVTNSVNVLRGVGPARQRAKWAARTHCNNNHPLSGANLYEYSGKNGYLSRRCKACALAADKTEAGREYKRLYAKWRRGVASYTLTLAPHLKHEPVVRLGRDVSGRRFAVITGVLA